MDPTIIAALISIAPSLLNMLFGGGDNQTNNQSQRQVTRTTALPMGYQSPTIGLQDLLLQQALGQNLQMLGGAGMPGGGTIAPYFLQDFLSLIGSNYEALSKKTKEGSRSGKRILSPDARIARKSYGNYAGR